MSGKELASRIEKITSYIAEEKCITLRSEIQSLRDALQHSGSVADVRKLLYEMENLNQVINGMNSLKLQ